MFVTFSDGTTIFLPINIAHKPTLLTLLAMIDCEIRGVPATKQKILSIIKDDAGLSEKSGTVIYRAWKKLQKMGLVYHKESGHVIQGKKKIGRGGKTAPYKTIFTLETMYDQK